MPRRTFVVFATLGATTTACIPYTVGTTAQPLRPGRSSSTLSVFAIPSVGILDNARGGGRPRGQSFLAADYEYRWGLDDRSDLGLRATSASGLVLNYKRLLTDTGSRARVALMPGAGFVNLGDHLHFELTLLVSGHESKALRPAAGVDTAPPPKFVPYGGLRLMQVVPIAEGAVSDQPTIGAFAGVKIGSSDFGISLEIGVFYDHSALGVRHSDLVVVPAVSVHGDRMLDLIGGIFGRGGILRTRRGPADQPPNMEPTPPTPVWSAPPAVALPSGARRRTIPCVGPRITPCPHPAATPRQRSGVYTPDASGTRARPNTLARAGTRRVRERPATAQRLPVRQRAASW